MAATTQLPSPSPFHFCNNTVDLYVHCNSQAEFLNDFDVRYRDLNRRRLWSHQSRGTFVSNVGRRRASCRIRCANTELRVLVESNSSNKTSSGSSNSNVQAPVVPLVEIPVTCYQILGVSSQAEKDEIVKSAMHLRNAQIEEGYTRDVVVSRQSLLMDVRDKLLFEPQYAVNNKDKVPPKSSLQIPWAWLPAALCLLQEAGEDRIVLDIGRRAVQQPDAKTYIHDILLSMALAECALAKIGFENNKISQGFEALARAQYLLRSKVSLGKMTLLSQIEESLEELAPACTTELLGMPRTPENAERRLGAIAALRELLRQGLDVEASCRVQDWPFFLNQTLNKLTASEIVELLQWDELALTRKIRKSLESQNQRVVIDFNSFYMVLIAHIALGFSRKQIHLINKGKTICESLNASDGVDLKFEESFCLFLLGQGDEATAAEKLSQLELDRDNATRESISGKETKEFSNSTKSLERWLKDSVLGGFPDTRDCSPSLVNFAAGKRNSRDRQAEKASNLMFNKSQGSLTPFRLDGKSFDCMASANDTSQHLGPAVKQLAPPSSGRSLIEGVDNSDGNSLTPSMQFKRNLSLHPNEVWGSWFELSYLVRMVVYIISLGCIMYAGFKLIKPRFILMWEFRNPIMSSSSSLSSEFSLDKQSRSVSIIENMISRKFRKLFSLRKSQPRYQPESAHAYAPNLAAGLSASVKRAHIQQMSMEEAEALVKRWQAEKSAALGPNHHIHGLIAILDEPMLEQWLALADAAKIRSCFWRFVLLQLSVLRAEILIDENGKELAEIEVILEEAAELVDETQLKNPNYYSTYKILYVLKKQNDGSWRFCEGDIRTPS